MASFPSRTVKWSNTVAVIRSGFAGEKDNSSSNDWKETVKKTSL